ncbi:hypothetical protein K443DRAFT_16219 [Laccaria amethystina LaAM-08-1]|uniref:Uncharacterized protein n=1 Tax=Laccaria amethystina LaAM-08-1 TaxID=1095629 RepID=A0A0C9WGF6_9AGAR|nr:hypothetical protein K443DRAFT_16219 [Laccaria amethystina LaAM-08-1]
MPPTLSDSSMTLEFISVPYYLDVIDVRRHHESVLYLNEFSIVSHDLDFV